MSLTMQAAAGPASGAAGYNTAPLYGAAAQQQSKWFQDKIRLDRRRRLNFVPILITILVPWVLLIVTFYVSAFSIRYAHPAECYFVLAIGIVSILVAGTLGLKTRLNNFSNTAHEPTWLVFLTICMVIAWVVAFFLGDKAYQGYTQKYENMMNLNTYADIDPSRMRGQMIMDAGQVHFTTGSRLDISHSMGFRNDQIYCVAPITFGNRTPPTYDFWAVGTNCCSGNQADFHCNGFNHPKASSGLRLMTNGARPYYRLAVQQAEFAYGLKAVHPLFFEWVEDSTHLLDEWKNFARRVFLSVIFGHLVFQAFVTVCAAIAFTRIGSF